MFPEIILRRIKKSLLPAGGKKNQNNYPSSPPRPSRAFKKSGGIDDLANLNVKLKFKRVGSASSTVVCSLADNHLKLQSEVPLDGSVSGEAGKMFYRNFRD